MTTQMSQTLSYIRALSVRKVLTTYTVSVWKEPGQQFIAQRNYIKPLMCCLAQPAIKQVVSVNVGDDTHINGKAAKRRPFFTPSRLVVTTPSRGELWSKDIRASSVDSIAIENTVHSPVTPHSAWPSWA